MPEIIQISAKSLGELALPRFCPKCFWLQLKLRGKLPWQIIPGIFSTIDSHTKKITWQHFEARKSLPCWCQQQGMAAVLVPGPHHSKFAVVHQETNIRLTGTPDVIVKRQDESFGIIDYKTARLTEHQNNILPMYRVQLNSYAYIAERCGFSPVTGIGLVYFQPQTDVDVENVADYLLDDGFRLSFRSRVLTLELDPNNVVEPLLRDARRLADMEKPPDSAEGCQDCQRLNDLIRTLSLR